MRKVSPGQKVRVGIETTDGQILQFFCYTKQVMQDRMTLMYSETKESFAKFLNEGAELRLSIYTPRGILLLSSIIISSPQNHEFVVEYHNNTKRIQRRGFLRVPANYRLIIEQYGRTYTVLTEDISGSGVRFMSDEQLQFTTATGKLFIPEHLTGIPFSGNIFQKRYHKDNEYVLHFKDITEANRSKIIQTCSKLEIENISEN